jgi:hypothetical protein
VTHQAATDAAVLWLACSACQLVYQPDPTAFTTGSTGCPRCSGWTWTAQLTTHERPAAETGRQNYGAGDTHPRPAVGGSAHPAEPASPTPTPTTAT